MKKLLMTLLAAMLPLLAFAGDWIEMFSQNGKTHYIYSTVEDEYNDHLVWIKITYDTPESRKAETEVDSQGRLVFQSKILFAFNTTWTKIKNKERLYLDENGNLISSYNLDDRSDWKYIVPGSVGASYRDYAKELYNSANSNASEK